VAPLRVSRAVASAGGIGFFPWAPGTAASAAATLLGAVILRYEGWSALVAAALLATLGGVLAIRAAEAADDPGWVVIDEVAGQWITLLGLRHLSLGGVVVAFVLFRLLDIAKPGPIGWADRQHNAVGVMADDVIAGLIGAAILWALLQWRPMLLG
jgi:phosphatidylglycerophosphatase A